jgi:hypothetical protein
MYAFFLVELSTGLPHGEVWWSRKAARERLRSMPVSTAAGFSIRRARLTVFPK